MVVSIVTLDNLATHRGLTSAVANGPFNFFFFFTILYIIIIYIIIII